MSARAKPGLHRRRRFGARLPGAPGAAAMIAALLLAWPAGLAVPAHALSPAPDAGHAAAADDEGLVADPAAAKAFAEMLEGYRAHAALKARSSVRISATDGGAASKSDPVTAELLLGRSEQGRRGVLKLRGYTCWLGDGKLTAVHDTNPDAYFSVPDDGSPYYALLTAFVDLPFPDLALAFGEEAPDEALMQLHPRTPEIVPVGVSSETVDGRDLTTLRFAGPNATVELRYDAATKLPEAMTVAITGGSMAPEGAAMRYEHELAYEIPAPGSLDAELSFDPGPRQKVDFFAALMKSAPAPPPGGGEAPHPLVGQPAPPLVLPLLDGGTLDLATLKGRVVVLDFWATWCGPCRVAMPGLHEIAEELRRDEAPVAVYTVNVFEREPNADKRREMVGEFWKKNRFSLPVALDLQDQADEGYQIPGIPMTVVIRSDGVVHGVHVGFNKSKLRADIQAAITALEAPAAPGAEPDAPEDAAAPESPATSARPASPPPPDQSTDPADGAAVTRS